MVIGTFRQTKDGGWEGRIQTLTINTQARFVPNDNRDNDEAPTFRILAGHSQLGAAWNKRAASEPSKKYLSVRLDDPALSEPIFAALFETEDSQEARLVWLRKRGD